MITDPALLLLLAILVVAFVARRAFERLGQRGRTPASDTPPPNAIVLDGSNVMHWNGDPSAKVLSRVLRDLEKKGLTPIVFFDANVGYKLGDQYMDEARLGRLIKLPPEQICVVAKGVVADEMLLAFAAHHGLRVVSNDRYRDWRVTYPHLAKKGSVVRGEFTEGAVKWRNKL